MSAYTEEQAKTKWCPLLDSHQYELACSDDACCVGSACMAWRWFDTLSDDGTAVNRKPTAHAKREPEPPRPLSDRRGFCGAFGEMRP